MSSFPLPPRAFPWPPLSKHWHEPNWTDRRTTLLKHIAQSERLAAMRPASRLEVRPRPEMLVTGIPEIDAMTGGIPRGCLTEIYGPASSGKTTVLIATFAAATQRDEPCVLIDATDSFDPVSGSSAGLDLNKLLWVRCGGNVRSKSVSSLARANDISKANRQQPTANDDFLARKLRNYNEYRLEQVLKATDLILQSGGFGLVALDLAGISEKFVRRIPLASWFRFQRAVEHTKTALLVITEFSCAQSCATLILKLCNKPSAVIHQPSGRPAHAELLEEMRIEAELVRSRLDRKPMQSIKTVFHTHAIRAG